MFYPRFLEESLNRESSNIYDKWGSYTFFEVLTIITGFFLSD